MSNNDNNNSNNNNNSPRRTSSTRSPSRSRSRSPSASRSPSPSPSTSIRKTDDNDKPTTTTTSSNNNNNNDNNNNDDHAKVEQQQQRRRRTPSPLVSSDGDRRDNNDKKKRSSNRRSTKRSRSRSRSRSVSSASSSASDYSSSSSSSSESDSDRRRGRRRRRGSRCEDRRRRSSSVSTSASSSASDSDSGRSRSRSRSRRNKEATATSMMDAGSDKKTMSDDQFFATLQNKPSAADLAAKNAEANAPTAMDVAKKFRTGGVYIPPFKMRRLQAQITDKSSTEYQRLTWEALKKSINGLINKVNVANIKNLIPEIFSENLVRGRGLFCRAIMKAQAASPGFTHVYAALVAVINTKMPELGELLVKRIVVAFRRSYQRNDKQACLTLTRFIAHLLNQKVVHEILALQLLNLLLGKPTDDSVELAVAFIKECGYVLNDMSPKNLHAVFERFRGILHEGEIDKRVQYMIEGLFAIRKRQFADYVGVPPELDLVEEEDQIMHDVELDQEDLDPETNLDYFHNDPDYERHEQEYQQIKREILGESSSEEEEEGAEAEEGAAGGSESESEEEEEGNNKQQQQQQQQQQQGGAPHKDLSEQELVTFRRNIYLTIMSSLNFEECAHKLLKYQMKPGLEMELCQMLIDCCSQERTYIRYYGLLGQRFCQLNNQREYQKLFEECFRMQYGMIHRLETNKLRNVAKFFAHLLYTDAIDWSVLECIHLNEEETTSSSRIFVKILFQELAELMGLANLNKRLKDPYLAQHFVGLFPKDIPKNTRFAINFFTSIGLGALTDELREHLKNAPKLIMQQKLKEAELLKKHGGLSSSSSSSDSDTDSSSSSSSDSDSDSDSDSSSSDSD